MMPLLILLPPVLLHSMVVLLAPVLLKVLLRMKMTMYSPQVPVPVEDSLDLDLLLA